MLSRLAFVQIMYRFYNALATIASSKVKVQIRLESAKIFLIYFMAGIFCG